MSSPRRARPCRAWRSPGASACSCRTAGWRACAEPDGEASDRRGSSRCPAAAACAPPFVLVIWSFCVSFRTVKVSLRFFLIDYGMGGRTLLDSFDYNDYSFDVV